MKKLFWAFVAGALTALAVSQAEARNPFEFMVRGEEPSLTESAEPLADWKAPKAAGSMIEYVNYEDCGCADELESRCCDPCWNEVECCCGVTGYGILGYDSFAGNADADFPSNYGALGGGNIGGLMPYLEEYGIGWQTGATFGVYDWEGRSANQKFDATQNMFFSTIGAFKRADACNPYSWAVGFDQLASARFGTQAQSPYLTQLRGMTGYALSARNEIGLMGAAATNRSRRGPFTYRAVSYLTGYLHHKYDFGADTWVSMGWALRDQLNVPNGTFGNFILSATGIAPMADNLSLYGTFTYMNASAPSGAPAVFNGETFNVGMGIIWYPGCNARSCTVGGQCHMPLLPVANNGNFLVEQGPGNEVN